MEALAKSTFVRSSSPKLRIVAKHIRGVGVNQALVTLHSLSRRNKGAYLLEKLTQLKEKFNCILKVRGLGLMLGVELSLEGKAIVDECLKNGLIINCTQGKVLRIMPALNVNKKQIDKAIRILDKAFETVTFK